MSASFTDQVNDRAREAAISAVVEVWRDLQGTREAARVIPVYAGSSLRAVGDLIELRERIDAELARRVREGAGAAA